MDNFYYVIFIDFEVTHYFSPLFVRWSHFGLKFFDKCGDTEFKLHFFQVDVWCFACFWSESVCFPLTTLSALSALSALIVLVIFDMCVCVFCRLGMVVWCWLCDFSICHCFWHVLLRFTCKLVLCFVCHYHVWKVVYLINYNIITLMIIIVIIVIINIIHILSKNCIWHSIFIVIW